MRLERKRRALTKMARVPPYPSGAARRRDYRQRALAAAIFIMLVGTQVLAALHFALVPHAFDARTSEVVHCHDTHDHRSGNQPVRNPDGSTPERDDPAPEKCPVHALLQQARILTSPPPTIQPSAIVEAFVSRARDTVARCRIRVYLLSPAHSPPTDTLS
jgi:hypothetical protein